MFQANMTYQKTISMVTEICCNCGVAFGLPSDLQEILRNDPDKWFYCPNGHRQHYSESREVRLRKEAEAKLEAARREITQINTSKIQIEGELLKTQRKLKRVHNGTCPCCKRTFQNLKNHIKSKHPELLEQDKK